MSKLWGDKRYNNINYALKKKFGEKIIKISLDGGFTCPNRDGTKGTGGCVFCSKSGSGDFTADKKFSMHNQFETEKEIMERKWKIGKYIAYFQAFTNTYAPVSVLRQKYEEALSEKEVVGLAIATRPDCLPPEVLELLEEINRKTYLWVELGLQTSSDITANKINRGYDLATFEKSVDELRKRNIEVVVHTIFGLPGEKHSDMLDTIEYLAKKDIQGIKLHSLHVLKDTKLEELYNNGEYTFLSKEDYIELLIKAITILPPEIVIHRITGDPPRNLLVGPMWSLKKWEILNLIDRRLKDENLYQGLYTSTK